MAVQFKAGETKIRPGNYERYSSVAEPQNTGARDGLCAIAIKATWGPVNAVVETTKASQVKEQFGDDEYDRAKSTVAAALAMFAGEAEKVYIVRMGTGGKAGSLVLKNADGEKVATLTAKYPGTLAISISIQEKLGDNAKKVLTVYTGTAERETLEFTAGENEVSSLKAAAKYSAYVTITPEEGATGALAPVAAASGALTGGEDPAVTTENYSKAWSLLEPYSYNTIALDVDDDENMTLSLLLKEYLDAAYATGKKGIAVVGEKISVNLATRMRHGKAFNDAKTAYFGSGYFDALGNIVDGVLHICLLAGIIASTPSNESITHKVLKGAVQVAESLSNEEYENAILNGVLMLSVSPEGEVWFDSGVNTLTTLAEDQDAGWKKIRRVRTRFETFDRIDRAVSKRNGRINGDSNGRAEVIQVAQGILNDMVKEHKYNPGVRIIEDPDNPPTSDSAWFNLVGTDTEGMVDLDSLEKTYLHYIFQASLNN